ncbi:MAG: FtsX-like permease family protein [Acidobacteria bacterium]|nr:MAG: FtsX-like permease family protein [Acidobacteriota bacterium]
MDWRTGFEQAFAEFARHKLRTTLTMLGMIFGVGAVVSMLAIGEGAEREALRIIDALGLRNIIVEAVPQPEERLQEIREQSLGLNRRDWEIALETLPQVTRSAAVKRVNVYTLFAEGGQGDAEVLGVSPDYFRLAHLRIHRGRPLTARDELTQAPVCVLGERAADALFGGRDPLGRAVKVNHTWLTVVGLLEPRDLKRREFEGVRLSGPENRIYLPLATARARFRFKPMEEELDAIHFEIGSREAIASAAATLGGLLGARHGGVEDFRVIVPEKLLAQHRRTQRVFDVVMAAIASISLLVGGIGIMNIMLANVMERTREIGVRRALGAKQRDIRRQFLIEAFAISLAGGAMGIALGFGLAWGISLFSGWPFAWSLSGPLLAVGICALVGLVFGIYPAAQAARLDPVEALNRGG